MVNFELPGLRRLTGRVIYLPSFLLAPNERCDRMPLKLPQVLYARCKDQTIYLFGWSFEGDFTNNELRESNRMHFFY